MTSVRINEKAFIAEDRADPDDEFPEGRVRDVAHWSLDCVIDGPAGTHRGPQRLEDLPDDADDEDLVQALRSKFGGTDEWALTLAD